MRNIRSIEKILFMLSICLFVLAFPVNAENITVDYSIYYMEYNNQNCQTGWIKGYDDHGNQLWYYQTGFHPATELSQVTWIGVNNGKVYFVEAGDVVTLDLETGYEVWRNSDFQGSPASEAMVFSSSGKLYLSGYYGPDLFIVSPDGVTLGKEDSIDKDSYWPYRIYFTTGDNLAIEYESNGKRIEINVTDYMKPVSRSSGNAGNAGNGYAEAGQAYLTTIDILAEQLFYGWGDRDPRDLGFSPIYRYKDHDFGFVIEDIDYDGQYELLIGEEYAGKTCFYDIFTLPAGRGPVQLLSGGERCTYTITEDGKIFEQSSSGADNSRNVIYRINKDTLEIVSYADTTEAILAMQTPAVRDYTLNLFNS